MYMYVIVGCECLIKYSSTNTDIYISTNTVDKIVHGVNLNGCFIYSSHYVYPWLCGVLWQNTCCKHPFPPLSVISVAISMDRAPVLTPHIVSVAVNVDSLIMPPTPPSSASSDSEGGHSPQRSAPSSPIRQLPLSRHSHSPTSSKSYSQPLFTSPVSCRHSVLKLYVWMNVSEWKSYENVYLTWCFVW